MFDIIHNKYANKFLGAPRDWDEKRDGKCEVLPCHFNGQFHMSWWAVPWRQRFAILFGAPIRLTVHNVSHPPVCLDLDTDNDDVAKDVSEADARQSHQRSSQEA